MSKIAVLSCAPLVSATSQTGAFASSMHSTRFPGVTWDHDAWTLTSTKSNNTDWHAQSFVANGYIGSSFASTGLFPYLYTNTDGQWWQNHYGTFGTVAGFFDRELGNEKAVDPELYQYGSDSVISGLPSWGPMVLDLGNNVFLDGTVNETELSNVILQQDFWKGSANYAYTWTPSSLNGFSVNVSYMAVADKLHPNRAYVHMNLITASSMNATIVNILDGTSSRRTDFVDKGMDGNVIYTAVRPVGVSNVTAWVFATIDGSGVDLSTLQVATGRPYISNNASTIAQSVEVSLRPNVLVSLTKYVGIASTDAFENPKAMAYNEMVEGKDSGFVLAFQQHAEEWATVHSEDSVTSFANPTTGEIPSHLIERQTTSIIAAFMLLMNTVSENAMNYVNNAPINVWGISVCGLTADCYAGQRFWDQDIYMGPYLATAHPFEAKQIALSRTSLYDQALANTQTAFTSSKNQTVFSPQAAIYPWSTGRDGNCTAGGSCWDLEYHINGDIVKGFVNYWAASGDDKFFKSTLLPITNSIAAFYSEIMRLNSSTGTWVLTNMTDPDEYPINIDNGAFRMALIQWTLGAANYFNGLFGQPQNSTWDYQADAIEIPVDREADNTLEYSGMSGSISVKHADVILRIYPLDNSMNYTISNQLADLDYYAAKQFQSGPGMTYAIFNIAVSAIVSSGCSAYTYDLYSWSPYLRAPWFTFSEGIVDHGYPGYPFLTGYGGFLQVDLMGYLGLRYGTSYNMQVSPNLPPQIPYIRFPVFYFQGWPIQAEMNQTHTTLARVGTPRCTANGTFAEANIAVEVTLDASSSRTFQLPPDGILILTNNPSSANLTIPNNILQCRPIAASTGTIVPGQFTEAAVDGASSTSWQGESSKLANSVTVDLTDLAFAAIDHIYVNWAAAVAANSSVIFHNSSDYTTDVGSRQINVPNVTISSPFDAAKQNVVQQYVGNSTNVSLADMGVWTGRYATLLVAGNQGDESSSAPGASVAEWAVIVR